MRDKLNYLLKYQKGGDLVRRGIKESTLKDMFNALVSRGVPNQAAFEIAWQSLKEKTKGYYSFGTTFKDLNSWANNVVNRQLKRPIYKQAVKATNFQEYRNATKAYNTQPFYTKWLQEGREAGRKVINNYIRDNNLGDYIAYNNSEENQFA